MRSMIKEGINELKTIRVFTYHQGWFLFFLKFQLVFSMSFSDGFFKRFIMIDQKCEKVFG